MYIDLKEKKANEAKYLRSIHYVELLGFLSISCSDRLEAMGFDRHALKSDTLCWYFIKQALK